MRIAKLLIVFFIMWSPCLKAKGGPPEGFSIGAGYIYSKSIYTGVEDSHLPMPFFSYKKGNLFIRGLGASYRAYQNPLFKFNFLLDAKFFTGGYEADDSSTLIGMDERKGTVTGGGQVAIELGILKLSSNLVKDLIGVHNGIEGDASLAIDFPISVLFKDLPFTMIGASFGLKYRDENFNNYYYGVKANEATESRVFYRTASSTSPWVSTFLRVSLNQSWTLMTIYKLEWLPNEIKDSPIVDKKKKNSVIAFLTYKF